MLANSIIIVGYNYWLIVYQIEIIYYQLTAFPLP